MVRVNLRHPFVNRDHYSRRLDAPSFEPSTVGSTPRIIKYGIYGFALALLTVAVIDIPHTHVYIRGLLEHCCCLCHDDLCPSSRSNMEMSVEFTAGST
jgi:hypothetical protein